MNKLILTHLWSDHGLLLARDTTGLLFMMCPISVFLAGKKDSLKKGWMVSKTGKEYRKIRKTKQCYSFNSAMELAALTESLGILDKVKESFITTYT